MENSSIFKTEKRIRLGIWGLGRGSDFIQSAKALNIDVIAGCDFDDGVRERFRKECPDVMITSDENEFLSYDMDAVLIATFLTDHAKHAIRALEAGFHVMSEVTSFFTPAEGVRLVEAVEKTGKTYNLLENYPFTKENMYLAKLWKEGFFGEFQYGEFDYLHEGRNLSYRLCIPPDYPPIKPGYTAHSWRSWLDSHYYCTHSLGPLMIITGLRPERITALPVNVSLPGCLPGSGGAKPCPSLIQMSNGGIMRNISGATCGDYYMGKRIWGTRAAAESLSGNLKLRLGAAGNCISTPVQPEWPELGEFADQAGHNGGNFWVLYYFARELLTGEKAPWDVYSAADVTLAGIMAVRSYKNGGSPVEIPDFRNPGIREKYRNDNEHIEPPFDPKKIFPDGHDTEKTSKFTRVISDLEEYSMLLRKALDGAAVYHRITEDAAKMEVIRFLHRSLGFLPDLYTVREMAKELISLYPESPAAYALTGMLTIAEPDILDKQEVLEQRLKKLMRDLLK